MKKNITITALAAVLVMSMSAFAFAGPGYGKGYGRGNCDGYRANYSQLTPEKQKAADAIIDKYSGQLTELRNQMITKHSVLEAMINDGDSNEKKIGKLVTDMSEIKDKMWDVRKQMTAELEEATGLVMSRGNGCQRANSGCPGFGKGRVLDKDNSATN